MQGHRQEIDERRTCFVVFCCPALVAFPAPLPCLCTLPPAHCMHVIRGTTLHCTLTDLTAGSIWGISTQELTHRPVDKLTDSQLRAAFTLRGKVGTLAPNPKRRENMQKEEEKYAAEAN